jgi:hypothetical protein
MHWTGVGCPWHVSCLEAVIYESCLISPCGLMDIYYWMITLVFQVQYEPEYRLLYIYKTLQLEQ